RVQGRTGELRRGPGLEEDVEGGRLGWRERAGKAATGVGGGVWRGAKVLAGGHRPEAADLKDGNFLKPAIFGDPPLESRVAREEVFGPVLAAFRFADLDEAILRANDTPYGLSAGVWTQDVAKAHAVAKRLQAGMVSLNEYPVTFPQTPFLGWKQSGLGLEQ